MNAVTLISITTVAYGIMGFLTIAGSELFPLMMLTGVDHGGMNLEARDICKICLYLAPAQLGFQVASCPRARVDGLVLPYLCQPRAIHALIDVHLNALVWVQKLTDILLRCSALVVRLSGSYPALWL